LIRTNAGVLLPPLRLADAPPYRRTANLTRDQIRAAVQKEFPELAATLTHWAGADQVQVTRRMRRLDETDIRAGLTARLQDDYIRDQGELELHLTRPWVPILVPDDPIVFRILDLPSTGVNPFFIVRFEIRAGEEALGSWQVALNAKVWRDVWVTRSAVRRGQGLAEADIGRERRDALALRESPLAMATVDSGFEIAENLVAGSPLYERSVRLRPVMRRGQVIEAQLLDGVILISMKVELLEDGSPGQLVRVRNILTKREFRGKVQDESTVHVAL
jgi:flagella basal body P-ring formation protein FlgA